MESDKKSYTLRMSVVLLSRIEAHSRKSGMTQAQVVIQACREYLDPDTPYMAPSTPVEKPDMEALRAICAGEKYFAHPDDTLSKPMQVEVPICGKDWWEDGEHFECLMDKGHRETKHGMRGMVRSLDA